MLEMTLWDVDHGSACYIKTPTGRHITIDLGVGDMSSGQSFSPLRHLRFTKGILDLDWLVITHPHRDHLDDIANLGLVNLKMLLANRSISANYVTAGNKPQDAGIVDEYQALLSRFTGTVGLVESTSNAAYWGCTIEYFTPVYSGPNLNNYSLVVIVSFAGTKIVIPGDNEAASWESLLANPMFVEAIKGTTIFVASHHGRESGYYAPLFNHFTPLLVLISDTNHGSTSVTGNYSQRATGWHVTSKRTGLVSAEPRKSLTTRNDGTIFLKCFVGADMTNYCGVETEK